MATFDQHILIAHQNIGFLRQIRLHSERNLNWEVTVCFYIAVHLVNAHISKLIVNVALHPRTHYETKLILDFNGSWVKVRIPENEYKAYTELMNLSRKTRYEFIKKESTRSKNVTKAEGYLNNLISYFNQLYTDLNITPV